VGRVVLGLRRPAVHLKRHGAARARATAYVPYGMSGGGQVVASESTQQAKCPSVRRAKAQGA